MSDTLYDFCVAIVRRVIERHQTERLTEALFKCDADPLELQKIRNLGLGIGFLRLQIWPDRGIANLCRERLWIRKEPPLCPLFTKARRLGWLFDERLRRVPCLLREEDIECRHRYQLHTRA